MDKIALKTTNWEYKGLRIYRDSNNEFYIFFNGGMHPIDFSGLPKTIQYDKGREVKNYSIHGKIGPDQE